MTLSRLRVGSAVLAAAAALLVAGCTANAETEPDTEATAEATAPAEETDPTAPVEVPDVTNLILDTAEGNLMRVGLEAEVVDAEGAAVTVDDATAFVVRAQEPADGTVDPGSTVTLTVELRG
jgi:hypothetical protein